jgi:CRISPR-associated endoribonuclease Cas6
MRLKLSLSCKKGALIAFNNRYELSAVLYRIIEKADGAFADWLHNEGYASDGRNFKLFTFGWLNPYPYEMSADKKSMIAKEGRVTWEVSFCVDTIIQHFVAGIFHEASFDLKAGFQEKVHFRVENVEILQLPIFKETMRYTCETPILIGRKNEGTRNETYLSPLDDGYEELFLHNLKGKVKAAQGETFQDTTELNFRLLSPAEKVKKKAFDIHKGKEKIRCVPFVFDFEVSVPLTWQHIGFLAGFGQDNALGLGMCKVLK